MPFPNGVRSLLKGHEGLRLKMYQDPEGVWTIGYGFNLEANEISKEIAEMMFDLTFDRAMSQLNHLLERTYGYDFMEMHRRLGNVRTAVIISMVFQMGAAGMWDFQKMRTALFETTPPNYEETAKEMLDSEWGRKYATRAGELATMMRTNEWQS